MVSQFHSKVLAETNSTPHVQPLLQLHYNKNRDRWASDRWFGRGVFLIQF